MADPALIINGVNYAPYIKELKPKRTGLNADGSGRDTQTGEMFRTKICNKMTFEVEFLRMYADTQKQLSNVLNEDYYDATILDPDTNTHVSKRFYTDTLPYGCQRRERGTGRVYYDGLTFEMIEK